MNHLELPLPPGVGRLRIYFDSHVSDIDAREFMAGISGVTHIQFVAPHTFTAEVQQDHVGTVLTALLASPMVEHAKWHHAPRMTE